ncbi:MAG: DMT family transporter [Actinomycetes bacterium]
MNGLALGVTAALAASACFAFANALQHRGASGVEHEGGSVLTLVRRVATHPMWLAGIGINFVGLGLHALALSAGALAVIQPLLVSALLFTLPVSRLVSGRHVGGPDYGWAALVVAGLSAFLLTANVTGGRPAADGRMLAAGIAGAAVPVVVALLLARRPASRHRAALFGLVTGVCCGVVAALLKQVTALALHGVPALLGAWPLYALLLAGAAALWFGQTAYRAGPITGSLPAITIVDPVVAIALGVLAFHEHLALDPPRLTVEVVAFAAMTAGVVALARRSLEPGLQPPSAQQNGPHQQGGPHQQNGPQQQRGFHKLSRRVPSAGPQP